MPGLEFRCLVFLFVADIAFWIFGGCGVRCFLHSVGPALLFPMKEFPLRFVLAVRLLFFSFSLDVRCKLGRLPFLLLVSGWESMTIVGFSLVVF